MASSVRYDEFLRRARDVHGDLYNYSLAQANYTTYKEDKIPIICSEHGVYYQTPYHHVYRRQGCRACAGNETVDFPEFLKRAESVHGDDYEYTEAAKHYTSFKGEKIPILCQKHKYRFWKNPAHHVSRFQGCPYCTVDRNNPLNEPIKNIQLNLETIIEKFLSEDIFESNILEFKTSIWQAFHGAEGHLIEDSSLDGMDIIKAICAFLNTNGGTLIIGLQDTPEPKLIGIEVDFKFCKIGIKEGDGELYLNKLENLILSKFRDKSLTDNLVSISLHDYDSMVFCVIETKPSKSPMYIYNDDQNIKFYRRGQAQSIPLNPVEQHIWIGNKERFPEI
tara:strand:+ start:128 stop:1132 length:1005 start_codon:yes stop_codon:yes gene_type:complete